MSTSYGVPYSPRYGTAPYSPPMGGYAPGYPLVRTGADVPATPATVDNRTAWEKTKDWFNGTTLRIPRKYLAGGALALGAIYVAYAKGLFGKRK